MHGNLTQILLNTLAFYKLLNLIVLTPNTNVIVLICYHTDVRGSSLQNSSDEQSLDSLLYRKIVKDQQKAE